MNNDRLIPLIKDLQTLRSWSTRQLAQAAGLSYTGVLDHLRGIPQRLSQPRIQRLLDVLNVNEHGILRDDRVHRWTIPADEPTLAALGRILETTRQGWAALHATEQPSQEPRAEKAELWQVFPCIGPSRWHGAPEFYVLAWRPYRIIVRWVPVANETTVRPVTPDALGCAQWAPDMEITSQRRRGVMLPPEIYQRLSAADEAFRLSPDEIDACLASPARDEDGWMPVQERLEKLGWNDVTAMLQAKYATPADAALALGLVTW